MTQTAKNSVIETAAQVRQRDQFNEWYDNGRISQSDMVDILTSLINVSKSGGDNPLPEKIARLKPIYLSYQNDQIDWDTYCEQALRVLDGESDPEAESEEIIIPLSPECRQTIEGIGAFVMNDRLETLNRGANPNVDELLLLAQKMNSLMQTLVAFSIPNNKHNGNIMTVFANFFANNRSNDECKTEVLQTQVWLSNNLSFFFKNADTIYDIACLTESLCDVLDKYYEDTRDNLQSQE
ncbi:MAG: hypothetical protein SNI20_05910 [Rikenellaceae bacterium]